jgi:hypothetical protein
MNEDSVTEYRGKHRAGELGLRSRTAYIPRHYAAESVWST